MFTFSCHTTWRPKQLVYIAMKKLRHSHPKYNRRLRVCWESDTNGGFCKPTSSLNYTSCKIATSTSIQLIIIRIQIKQKSNQTESKKIYNLYNQKNSAVASTCRLTLLRIPAHPIAKVKTLTRGLGLGFDLLTSVSVHAEVLPWTICLPTLVLMII